MKNILSFLGQIKRGATLNLLVQLSSNFGLGFAAYYFKMQGVELYKLILIWAISPLVSLPIVAFYNHWPTKKFLRLGILSFTGMSLSLLFYNPYSYLLFAVFSGLTLGLFWVSCNYIFFLRSNDSRYAKDSSVYFLLGPLLGMVLPPLGSVVINSFSYKVLFLITLLLSLLPLWYVQSKDFDLHLNKSFRQANQDFNGLRLLTAFDAALHFFQGHFLAIYALLFLKTEYQVGGLLSYLAIASLAASFIVSHASDKYKKRVEILYPLLFAMSILILLVPLFDSLSALLPLIGAYAVLDNLSLPIRFAVPMDLVKMDIGFWRMSEFYGNLGRTIVFATTALLLYLGNKWAAFVIFTVMTLAFPFIISHKIKTLRVRQNLASDIVE
jgi:MFS family permease